MLMVWVNRIEDTYWAESKEIRDEEEAISVMLEQGIWPDQVVLVNCPSECVIPTDWKSPFDTMFNEAYLKNALECEEERDRREYLRLKWKYENG